MVSLHKLQGECLRFFLESLSSMEWLGLVSSSIAYIIPFSYFDGIRVCLGEISSQTKLRNGGLCQEASREASINSILVINVNFYRCCIDLDFCTISTNA